MTKSRPAKELLRQKASEMHFDQTDLTHFRDFPKNLVAQHATVLPFFAFAENRSDEHMKRAFQASSPKNFPRGWSSDRPFFFVLSDPRQWQGGFRLNKLSRKVAARTPPARHSSLPAGSEGTSHFRTPKAAETLAKCNSIKLETRNSAISPMRLVAPYATMLHFFAFAAKPFPLHKERAFQASSPKLLRAGLRIGPFFLPGILAESGMR